MNRYRKLSQWISGITGKSHRSINCIKCLSASFLILLFTAKAYAVPVQWGIGDGGNGNWYDLVFEARSWTDAKTSSESMIFNGNNGHLATVTSAGENSFLVNNFLSGHNRQGFWLGGYQLPGQTTTDQGWQWVTGEVWNYSNWWLGNVVAEPNDWPGMGIEDGQEDFMGFSHESFGQWNDTKNNEPWMSYGYFVEYETITSVPEPSIILLISTGLLGLLFTRCRQQFGVFAK
jgi:hypothetical protein